MAIPTTLFEYYQQQGKQLPTLAERAPIFQQLGLGQAATYIGTTAQNTALLQKLISPQQSLTIPPVQPIPSSPVTPIPTPSPTPTASAGAILPQNQPQTAPQVQQPTNVSNQDIGRQFIGPTSAIPNPEQLKQLNPDQFLAQAQIYPIGSPEYTRLTNLANQARQAQTSNIAAPNGQPTAQSIQSQLDILKQRIAKEGITQGSQTLLAPGAYDPVTGKITIQPEETTQKETTATSGGISQGTAKAAESDLLTQVRDLMKEFGISPISSTTNNFSALTDYLNQAYTNLGLTDLKTQIGNTTKQVQEIENDLANKEASINDNPFISEGLRSKQIIKARELSDRKKDALVNRLRLDEALYEKGVEQAKFVAQQALTLTHQQQQTQQDYLFKALDIAIKEAESKKALGKDERTTVNNLIQNYPDAGITPGESLVSASKKAAASESFATKNTLVRAIVDPVNGGITYYYSKGGGNQIPGTEGTPFGNVPPPVTKISIPPIIQAAVEKAGDFQYIDMGKLVTGQIPLAQRVSTSNNIPLLSKEDASKVQEANQSYLSASALIQQVRNLTKDVITARNDRVSMGTQAAGLEFADRFPVLSKDNQAKEFISARKSLLSLITRASGEKGVLTDTDVNRIANALPGYGDNKELGLAKANNLDEVIKSVFSGAIGAYIGSVQTGPSGSANNLQGLSGQTSTGIKYQIIK